MDNKEKVKNILNKLNEIVIYRNVINNSLIRKAIKIFQELLKEKPSIELIYAEYSSFYKDITECAFKKRIYKNIWPTFLAEEIAYDENPFSRISEKYGFDAVSDLMIEAVEKEIGILKEFCSINIAESINNLLNTELPDFERYVDGSFFKSKISFTEIVNTSHTLKGLWELKEDKFAEYLSDYYHSNGCGIFGKYKAFRWVTENGSGQLKGIENVDPITFEDLIGYEEEHKIVIENTKALLKGFPANNVLLYGDKGTGKSSTIKALLNEFYKEGLRLIEINKNDVKDLSYIIDIIKDRGMKFILFFDDLSFDESEVEYKELKSVLEGGVEVLPLNVVIYATSNRRHIVTENIEDNELHNTDAREEKLSLSDRFGITVTFVSPSQEEYLKIVKGLAQKHNIEIEWNLLKEKALQWAIWHNGRSPRSAKQFIDHLRYELSKNTV
ncbi:putative ATPase (AAA+ superfamily) [Thermoanaerobacter thermohydrosulfuricus WC1]|uniref:Putative ATPase (AAA+ superfamily) n=1 Tax=Thermoanaerobacter thermohydrosulfuricus WC1 TaxID=1198630 RepID=M8DDX2_THETY|nr:ATP-binding protein [Thermoanaerobacter thermohydrosulfuricus]EMT38237.1 putative ATPase (AAA+ superfamily) [Thermoanaerobacter thermohydrosulfuricus WC1]